MRLLHFSKDRGWLGVPWLGRDFSFLFCVVCMMWWVGGWIIAGVEWLCCEEGARVWLCICVGRGLGLCKCIFDGLGSMVI